MTGVTPRQAQAHKDKGGAVMELTAFGGIEKDVSDGDFSAYFQQDTPRPQWRLVPIPELTVTIKVPKRWVETVARATG